MIVMFALRDRKSGTILWSTIQARPHRMHEAVAKYCDSIKIEVRPYV